MDSNEDFPTHPPVPSYEEPHTVEHVNVNEDQTMAVLVPIVQRQPSDMEQIEVDDDMPALISIADPSDDADTASVYYSSEEDESEWENEDELAPPPHEHISESHEAEPAPSAPLSRLFPPFIDDAWSLPRRRLHTRRENMVLEGLLEALAMRMETDEMVASQGSDLERAKLLVNGLERVSGGLLTRVLRVGGAPGAYEDLNNQDEGVAGCAICWAALLDQHKAEDGPVDNALPYAPNHEDTDIVSLPCAHVFHSSCLFPWFARKTSCPTCRFDVDPDSLTRCSQHPFRDQGDHRHLTSSHLVNTEESMDDHELHDIDTLRADIDVVGRVLSVGSLQSESDALGDMFDFRLADSDLYHFELRARSDSTSHPFHANKSWTLPDAPGKSLRQKIEDKEREKGLRCLAATCIFAPTDEAPHATTSSVLRQISIHVAEATNCKHAMHPACLVRTACLTGWRPILSRPLHVQNDFSTVEVFCSSCLGLGTVSREDWEEGTLALDRDEL